MSETDLNNKVTACLGAELHAFKDKRPVIENIVVCLYELGRVARSLIYSHGSIEKKELSSFCAEMCNELADVICQSLVMYMKLKGYTKGFNDISCEELIDIGLERQQERMGEVAKSGVKPQTERLQL